ncbi:hypothetical protein HanXRQr2_Chr17g0816211 [Helianthus annuus]|uniref:Uncharacterized protein n=1 Tax=Helianthus annuus TaxID=4232 RepID=A0A9K3GVE8_HELAN|nr:hypothetical protein HanXRQr2_Chr17g0816211 [Helianthus annuus]
MLYGKSINTTIPSLHLHFPLSLPKPSPSLPLSILIFFISSSLVLEDSTPFLVNFKLV